MQIDGGKGFFHRADDLRRREQRMKIAQEEIFGPVLSVLTFDDIEK